MKPTLSRRAALAACARRTLLSNAARPAAESLEGRRLFAGGLPPVVMGVIDGSAGEPTADAAADAGRFRIIRVGTPLDTPVFVALRRAGEARGRTAADVAAGTQAAFDFDYVGDAVGPNGEFGVLIPAGTSTAEISIVPLADGIGEGPETFGLGVAPRAAGVTPYTFDPAATESGTIRDYNPQTVTVTADQPVAAESGDRPAVFTFRRTGDVSQATTLDLSYPAVMTDGDLPLPSAVVFSPGQTEQKLYFAPYGDALVEGPEVVGFTVASANPDVAVVDPAQQFTIEDGPVGRPAVALRPTADAYVEAGAAAGRNFGSASELMVRDPLVGPARTAYLTFDISSIDSVASAELALRAHHFGPSENGGMLKASVVEADGTMSELAVTYDTRPTGPLSGTGGTYVGGAVNDGREMAVSLTDAVQRQRLLGADTITVVLAPDTTVPAIPSWRGLDVSIDSREGAQPPELLIESQDNSSSREALYLSHRTLAVPEGGTADLGIYTNYQDVENGINVFKVPGGDPDINASVGRVRADGGQNQFPLRFAAGPDTDTADGAATFIISMGGSSRVVTVRESDTGVNIPPVAPGTIVVPLTADGFAQNGATAVGGLSDDLMVRNAGGGGAGTQESFLQVDLTGLPAADQIGEAKVRLYGSAGGTAAGPAGTALTRSLLAAAAPAPVAVSAFAAGDTDWYWDEQALAWQNRPGATGSAAGTVTVGAQGWYEIDVAPLVRARKAAGAKTMAIALKGATAGTTSAVFASDEASANRPTLVVKKGAPPPPPTPTTTVTARAAADAHVRDGTSAGTNYGQAATMEVKRTTAVGWNREAFLKFDLSAAGAAAGAQSAKVRLFGKLAAAGADVTLQVFPVADTAWTESGLKWSNKPAAGATALGTLKVSGTTGTWYELDVSAYVKQLRSAGKTAAAFVVRAVTAEGQVVQLTSDEASANRPELKVVKAATTPPPTTITKTLSPKADATVRDGASAATNFGGAATLDVKRSTIVGNARQSWLRFDLTGITTVTAAKLRLFGKSASATGTTTVQVLSSANTTWGEAAIAYGNRPATGAVLKTFAVAGTTAKWYEVDLTAFLKAERAAGRTAVTVVLAGANTPDPLVTFNSDEAASSRPVLVVS
ncbi:MAG TPA: DNRLRE domain-containing protein [Humisphaera sp.]